MDYTIRGFNKHLGTIEVAYAALGGTEHTQVPVPLDDQGLYIIGSELDSYIQSYATQGELQRRIAIRAGIVNESEIDQLVEPIPQPENLVAPWTLNTSTGIMELFAPGHNPSQTNLYDWKVEVRQLIQEVITDLANGTNN